MIEFSTGILAAVLFALLCWWLGTGVILWLVRLPVASGGLVSNGPRTPPEVSRTAPEQQVERDQLARSVLAQELVRARQLQASLLDEYRQGDPVRSAAEVQSPPKYQERVASLKAAIERTERDIDSLQRELARRPLAAKTPSP